MLLQVPQKQSSTKEAKVAPAALSKSIYQSNYEAPIETSQQEVEDGADDVFDMLLQVPEKQSSTKEAKVAPVHKAASIYQSNYEAPIETSQQEVEDGADDVFDMLLQVPQKEEKSSEGALIAKTHALAIKASRAAEVERLQGEFELIQAPWEHKADPAGNNDEDPPWDQDAPWQKKEKEQKEARGQGQEGEESKGKEG